MPLNQEYKKEKIKFNTKLLEITFGLWIGNIIGTLGIILSVDSSIKVRLLVVLGLVVTFALPIILAYFLLRTNTLINELKDEQ